MLGLISALVPATVGAAKNSEPADRVESILTAATRPASIHGELPANTLRSRFVSLATDSLGEAGSSVSFELFPGEVVTGVIDAVDHEAEASTWSGSLDDDPTSAWTAARVGDAFHLWLSTATGTFEVTKAGPGVHRVAEVAPATFTRDGQVEEPRMVSSTNAGRATLSTAILEDPAVGDAGDVADVLVVATTKARDEAGGEAALAAHVNAAVAQMNVAMQRSAVPGQIRLAGLVMTNTAEVGGDLDIDLTRLRAPNDGFFDEAQPAREATHADFVSLWVGGPVTTSCGLGYLAKRESSAYHALFAKSCATANMTFAHESGHNFQLEHDANASESPTGQSIPHARGYSYVNPTATAGWYTIMAYPTACLAAVASRNCRKIQNYSNPNILEDAVPTGTAAANNALALSQTFASVANYRQERITGPAPVITGRPLVGTALGVTTGSWLPSETTFGYQWYADGAPLAGKTSSRLKVMDWMLGRTLSVQVTASAPYYEPVALASLATAPVTKRAFSKRRVRLVGKAKVGSTLRVLTKIRPNTKRVNYTWYRNGNRIKGVKRAAYRLTRKDRGKKIQVKVKARKSGYTTLVKRSNKRRVR